MGGLSFGMDMSMNMGGGFSPFAVGQPIVLFDAARGITLNGADVSGWADQSGRANNAAQGGAAAQPVWNAASANFNGQPSLGFDGTEWIKTNAFVGGDIPQPSTMILVALQTTSPAQHIYTDGLIAAKRHNFWSTTGNLRWNAGGNALIFADDTSPHVIALLANGASGEAWRDGTSSGVVNAGANVLDGLNIGRSFDNGGFLTGEIAYLLIYDFELTAVQRNYIGSGLAARFGTTNGWS